MPAQSETPFADFLGGTTEFRRAIADWRHAVAQVLSQYRGATGDYRGQVLRATHDARANPAGGLNLPTFPTFPGLPPFPLGGSPSPAPGPAPAPAPTPQPSPAPSPSPAPVPAPTPLPVPSPLVSPYPRGDPRFNPWWADLISKGPRLKPYPTGVTPNRVR